MAWRDEIRPASFRGVPFEVDTSQGAFGRRTVTHQYPQRDKPFLEDLGRSAREFEFQGFVTEPNYLQKKNDLIKAVEGFSGPGELIHPYFGTLSVIVTGFSVNETWREGGKATFTFKCTESGQRVFPSPQEDTADVVQQRARVASQQSLNQFTTQYTIADQPDFIHTEAQNVVRQGLDAINAAKGS